MRLLLLLALSTSGCVTASDLHEISSSLEDLAVSVEATEAVLNDFDATPEDLEEAVGETNEAVAGVAETLADVQRRVSERTEEAIDKGFDILGDGGPMAAIAGLMGLLLNLWRNSTREKRLNQIGPGSSP